MGFAYLRVCLFACVRAWRWWWQEIPTPRRTWPETDPHLCGHIALQLDGRRHLRRESDRHPAQRIPSHSRGSWTWGGQKETLLGEVSQPPTPRSLVAPLALSRRLPRRLPKRQRG